MIKSSFTYQLVTLILFLCLSWGNHINVSAQRAKKHREGNLTTDTLTATTADGSKKDTLSLQDKKIRELEAPVDTAALAQKNDSIQKEMLAAQKKEEKKRWLPVSSKSVWFALAIPGAGQIYNRKYWKLPIIYGGFVGCSYALTWNNKMYKDYSQAYQDIMSDNPNNDSYMDFMGPGMTKEDVQANLSRYQDLFRKRKDLFRRQRDLSIFAFIGVYLLSVIDAYVDAELSNFDISRDLTMTVEPAIFNDAYRKMPQGIGVQCNIKF